MPPEFTRGSVKNTLRPRLAKLLRPSQQLRQLGNIDREPPCLVAREQSRCRPPPRLILAKHVTARLPAVVARDEANAVVPDVPMAGSGGTGLASAGI